MCRTNTVSVLTGPKDGQSDEEEGEMGYSSDPDPYPTRPRRPVSRDRPDTEETGTETGHKHLTRQSRTDRGTFRELVIG